MTLTYITLAGLSAILLGLLWWKRIQRSRKEDRDFQIRDLAKEELSDQDSIL